MSTDGKNLNLPIPEGQREIWASQLATEAHAAPAGSKIRRFVFRIGAEWFGLDPRILSLTLPDIRPRQLPHRADGAVEGLINADGRIVICIKMPRLWDIFPSQQPQGQNRHVLVMNVEGWIFAMRVDQVLGIEDFIEEDIQPVPHGAPEALRRCSQGVLSHQGRAVSLLHAGLFAEEVRRKLP
jgi:chemotaxis signal transduction protein